jgi:hypothetical protein
MINTRTKYKKHKKGKSKKIGGNIVDNFKSSPPEVVLNAASEIVAGILLPQLIYQKLYKPEKVNKLKSNLSNVLKSLTGWFLTLKEDKLNDQEESDLKQLIRLIVLYLLYPLNNMLTSYYTKQVMMSTSGDLRQANHIKYTKMLIESISGCASTLTSFTSSDEELMAYPVCSDNIKHAIISDSELEKEPKVQMWKPMGTLTENYYDNTPPDSDIPPDPDISPDSTKPKPLPPSKPKPLPPSKPNIGPYKPPPSSPGLLDNFWQQFKPRD